MKKLTLSLLFASLHLIGCSKTEVPEPEVTTATEEITELPAEPTSEIVPQKEEPKVVLQPIVPTTPIPASKAILAPEQFMDAALNGQLAQVQAALEAGQNPNFADEGGRTALMLAGFNGHTAIVNTLIGHGAMVTLKDKTNRSALMYTSTGNNPDAVKLLLQHGAKVNAIDNHEDWTPLMFAAAEGHTEVVKLLLDHKADVDMKDTDGDTAGNFAEQRGHTELAKMLHGLETPAAEPAE